MARILAISSQVASGYVGLSAMVPAWHALGHEVIALPTILLANHPGRQATSGVRIDADVLGAILATLDANGRLEGVDAILTGYLPSAAHVAMAREAVRLCKRKSARAIYLCDPVLGDDPKGLYIDLAAADALRNELVSIADVTTPNRFELAWLTRLTVDGPDAAVTAARTLGCALTIATSIPAAGNMLATLAIRGDGVEQRLVTRHADAPNGTGDLLAALILDGVLHPERPLGKVLADAVSAVEHILVAGAGRPEMALIDALAGWQSAREAPR
jgi:pyridoxine kinase